MTRTFFVLLILISTGILLLSSTFWTFDREKYVNNLVLDLSRALDGNIDVEYLKKEFEPAYGY